MSAHILHRMMSSIFTSERTRWVGLGALLAVAIGCTPTTNSATGPAAATAPTVTKVDLTKPQASPVTPVAEGPQAEELTSKVKKVTVYSDRALVTHHSSTSVGTTPTVYAFKHLPGWVDDGSVRLATSAGRILDVRVNRSYLARATDETIKKAEDEAQQLANKMTALEDELTVLDAQKKQIEDIKAFSLEKVTKDMTTANVGVESYGSVVKFISKSLRETAGARRAVQSERTKLLPEIQAGQRKLAEMRELTQLEETTVLVTLQNTAQADAKLVLTYMLPGATWEPMHEFRVSEAKPDTVEVTSFAVVTQTSGEDWSHAELTFSTQSSTETIRIPELEALTLGDTKTASQFLRRQSASFSRAQAAFAGQNRLWNKRLQKSSHLHNFEERYQSNFEYLQVVQGKTVQIFQSLRKRGTTAHFKAISSAIVRADGHSVRLPIGRSQFKAKQKIVAAPEQSLNAARTLEMLNESAQPLLPGKVALYQDGAFLGMTNVEFIADGERFSLFLNVADQLKLSRVLDKKHSTLVRKRRTRMKVAFIVTVENLSSKTTSLTLADRIPVSENRDIVLSGVRISPTVKPDSKGILYWQLTLKPKEKRQFKIQYQIEYPPTLILETRRNRARMRRPASPYRGKPAPRKNYNLNDDIYDLEQNF